MRDLTKEVRASLSRTDHWGLFNIVNPFWLVDQSKRYRLEVALGKDKTARFIRIETLAELADYQWEIEDMYRTVKGDHDIKKLRERDFAHSYVWVNGLRFRQQSYAQPVGNVPAVLSDDNQFFLQDQKGGMLWGAIDKTRIHPLHRSTWSVPKIIDAFSDGETIDHILGLVHFEPGIAPQVEVLGYQGKITQNGVQKEVNNIPYFARRFVSVDK